MNIKQIIAEEAVDFLKERGAAGGLEDALGLLSQIPEAEAGAHAAKLLKVVDDALPGWIEQQAQQEQVAEGLGGWLKAASAKTLKAIPGGMDLGAMYLASLDRQVPATLRMAFLIAIANFVSPVDVGTLLGLDFLGPLAVIDDIVLLRRVLKKYQKAGLPADRHYDHLAKLAGAEDELETAEVPAVEVPPEDLAERKLKKSHLYKVIREEVEVVLTNEEAEEMFDLNMTALLDEMMSETESDSGSDFLKSKGHDPETAVPFKGTKTKRGAAKHQRGKEKPVGKEIEDLEETEDKSFSKAGEEIKEKGTEGVFTAKADKAGMGVQAYAAKVLKKGSKASTKTKRQAAFAKGAATVARENK